MLALAVLALAVLAVLALALVVEMLAAVSVAAILGRPPRCPYQRRNVAWLVSVMR